MTRLIGGRLLREQLLLEARIDFAKFSHRRQMDPPNDMPRHPGPEGMTGL